MEGISGIMLKVQTFYINVDLFSKIKIYLFLYNGLPFHLTELLFQAFPPAVLCFNFHNGNISTQTNGLGMDFLFWVLLFFIDKTYLDIVLGVVSDISCNYSKYYYIKQSQAKICCTINLLIK